MKKKSRLISIKIPGIESKSQLCNKASYLVTDFPKIT